MRNRPATVLAIAGVVAAGLVAGLVNAQALAGSDDRGATSLASLQLDASSSVPTTSSVPGVDAPPTVFAAGVAGTLTLDQVNGVLSVVAIAPAAGWSVSKVSSVDATTTLVEFVSAGTVVQARAVLRDAVFTVELTETMVGVAAVTTVAAPPTTVPPAPAPAPAPTPTTAPSPTSTTTVRPPTSVVPSSVPSDDNSGSHHGGSDDGSDDG
ncbi:MAG: hypothetical protein ACOYL9_10650, partial [Ilumatobacteraceae bacterium]